MKINFISKMVIIGSLLFSSLAFSLDLDQAKQNGWVGEKDNGYLGLVEAKPGVQSLVDEINEKRRMIYNDLAKKNNISLEQVEKLAAQKAYAKTPAGHYVWVNGAWVKK